MNKLFEEIKAIRTRDAGDVPKLVKLVLRALSQIKKLKPEQKKITHKGRNYVLLQGRVKSTTRITRPFREDLFDNEEKAFLSNNQKAFVGEWKSESAPSLERFVYTAQQAIGCYLDLFNPPAAARVAGTVFESLIACALNRVCGLPIVSGTVKIPNMDGKIQTDLGIRQGNEFVLLAATKTSTRERLSQPFVQKYIIDRAIAAPPKSILIVIGDIQRMGTEGVQHTFTAGQFQLYWEYLTTMDGVYYIDVPPQAETKSFRDRVKRLKDLFYSDLNQMVG